jgi:hypothetical protein
MPTISTPKGSDINPAATDPAQRARLRASLAGFEERLRRCRREAQSFLDEHWNEARYRSDLAFLLGRIHGVIEHCRELESRYRCERIHLATLDATLPGASRERRDQADRAGGSSASACG